MQPDQPSRAVHSSSPLLQEMGGYRVHQPGSRCNHALTHLRHTRSAETVRKEKIMHLRKPVTARASRPVSLPILWHAAPSSGLRLIARSARRNESGRRSGGQSSCASGRKRGFVRSSQGLITMTGPDFPPDLSGDAFRTWVLERANAPVRIRNEKGRSETVTTFEARLLELASGNCQRRIWCMDFIRMVQLALTL
ncbi:hypothetical protein BV96_02396 [Sphingomonas paucimobilis]|nr:hypothetical protein BV96_02396 [Sphingomonas paucimobilis]